MSLPFLLLATAAAVAVTEDDDESTPETLIFTGLQSVPWVPDPESTLPPRAGPALVEHRVAFSAAGKSATVSFQVPADTYTVVVRARTPDIGYKVKLGGHEYGIGWGPPGSTPVLDVISKAVSIAAKVAPDTAGDALSTAIGTAIDALAEIVTKLPDLVARGRVKIWTKFRAGRWGTHKKREAVRDRLALWYGKSASKAAGVSNPHGYWRFEGGGAGEWPVVATTPESGVETGEPLSGAPTVKAQQLAGGYLRVTVKTDPMEHPGEVRWDVTLRERR